MPAKQTIPIGTKFGRLTVIGNPIREYRKPTKYKCQCNCGNITISIGANLSSGCSSSCGCARKETLSKLKTKHGDARSRLHMIWCGMKARCANPNHISFPNYGARGIKVCQEWEEYEIFLNWAKSNGYKDDLSLDRINSDGPYSPNNCRWASSLIQNRNSRHNHIITYNGNKYCISEWSEITGIKATTIRKRLSKGWTIEKTLTNK